MSNQKFPGIPFSTALSGANKLAKALAVTSPSKAKRDAEYYRNVAENFADFHDKPTPVDNYVDGVIAELHEARKDSARLEFMIKHEAFIENFGTYFRCNHYVRGIDGRIRAGRRISISTDGKTPREAIDRALAGEAGYEARSG